MTFLARLAQTANELKAIDPELIGALFHFKYGVGPRADEWRVDPTLLYRPFLIRACRVLVRCEKRGARYYATSGLRSWNEQAKRHAAYKNGTGTRAAAAGYSAHQFGNAIDFAADSDLAKPGLQASWKTPAYKILVDEVLREGLVSGSAFNDTPHVQVPRFVSGASMKPLREAFVNAMRTGAHEEQAVRAVWAYQDSLPLFPIK